jgi:hypothetical protein
MWKHAVVFLLGACIVGFSLTAATSHAYADVEDDIKIFKTNCNRDATCRIHKLSATQRVYSYMQQHGGCTPGCQQQCRNTASDYAYCLSNWGKKNMDKVRSLLGKMQKRVQADKQ